MENENLERDLEAIEREKQEYLKENSESPEEDKIESENSEDSDLEEVEVEETEFSLSKSEIDEWIEKLMILKEEKNSIELDIDNETVLKINYSEDSGEDEEDELKSDEVID